MSITLPTRTPAHAAATLPATTAPADTTARPVPARPRVPDNRPAYLAWGLAWLIGHGSFALAGGDDPLLSLPALLPPVLLGAGVLTAGVITVRSSVRDQRGVTGPAKTAGTLFGIAWLTTFAALTLLITALDQVLDRPLVATLLWPTGSAIVVGLMYVMGGTLQRDLVQYGLGSYLAVLGGAAVFLGDPGHYGTLALAGAPAYFLAAALEGRRRVTAIRRDLAIPPRPADA